MRVLIIGYGNPLRSDDGFGWHAAQQLSSSLQSSNIEATACQQLTPDLAETVSHFQRIIFIDAARDLPPGKLRCEEVVLAEDRQNPAPPGFTHFVTPSSILAWTADLYAKFPQAFYISVGGEDFGDGDTLSLASQAAFQPLLAQVRSLIASA